MLVYKINILDKLKEAGYSSYKMRREQLLGEATIQKLRENRMIGIESIDSVCRMLQCQPGDIIEFQDEKRPRIRLRSFFCITSFIVTCS